MSNYAIEVENLCISYKGLKSYSIKRNFFKKKEKKKERKMELLFHGL